MKYVKSLLDFYLNASIHVAISVLVLYFTTVDLMGVFLRIELAGFLFFSTIVCYNFIKYGVEAPYYLLVPPSWKHIQWFSFGCFGLAGYFFWKLNSAIWLPIAILTLAAGCYAIPFLPNARNLRSLGSLKIYLVALVWAGFTVWVPLIDAEYTMDWDSLVLFIGRFLVVLALLIPFEIRDLPKDTKELRTLPQQLGVSKTQYIGYGLLAAFMLLPFFKDVLLVKEIGSNLAVAVLLAFAIYHSKPTNSPYFTALAVEGIPIVGWCVLLVL